MSSEKIVLFIDVLGFASLTEAHPLELDQIRSFEQPFSVNVFDLVRGSENPLTHAFTSFHHALRSATEIGLMSRSMTAITFSDSAFIAMNTLYDACGIASQLMRWLLKGKVPVRIGIACGTFEAIRFRSDIMSNSGDHAAHFLGSGVVRAHAAESCGIKGMRVLFHPSVNALLKDEKHNPIYANGSAIKFLKCPESELKNKTGVEFEHNYWSLGITDGRDAWHSLQDMWDRAPPIAEKHYIATADAINRMRVARGEPDISNLRRRTLPRTKHK